VMFRSFNVLCNDPCLASAWPHGWQKHFYITIYNTIMCILFVLLFYIIKGSSSHYHCATSRKVAGSIPDGVIGIFR
jgi:hypothetical protein